MLTKSKIREKYEHNLRNYIRSGKDIFLDRAETIGEILELTATEEQTIFERLQEEMRS